MKNTYVSKTISIAILLIAISYMFTFGTSAQELCDGENSPNGAIDLRAEYPYTPPPDFVAGLLGTIDRLVHSGKAVGGLDWLYTDDVGAFSTTTLGGQLIGWWTRKNNRNTIVQVTNQSDSDYVSLHIQFFDENCLEVRDFCDDFSPYDTHTYDLSDLVRNGGSPIPSSTLTDHEGIVTVTPVVDCSGNYTRAISFPFLHGDIKIHNSRYNYEYGAKMWARGTIAVNCVDPPILDGGNGCRFTDVLPRKLSHVFSVGTNSDQSRADLVIIAIEDEYDPYSGYSPLPGSVRLQPFLIDLDENSVSCRDFVACFSRIGLNQRLPNSDLILPILPIKIPRPNVPGPPVSVPPVLINPGPPCLKCP